MMFTYLGTTVSAFIPAAPEQLWSIISDVTRHPELAGSGEVLQTELLTPAPLNVGSRFQSQQNMRGMRYVTVSHVVVCEPPHRLAWRIGLPGTLPFAQIWQFVLTPREDGTQVEHGVALPYVVPQVPPVTFITAMVTQGEASAMTPTLVNLAKAAGVTPPDVIDTHLQPPDTATALLPSPLFQGSLWLLGTGLAGALLVRRATHPTS